MCKPSIVVLAALAVLPAAAPAQPFNVRAWYAAGQVFVVWEFPALPAVATDTVEIYASPGVQPDTAFMQLVGRLFFPEYTGGRLALLAPAALLTLPTPGGGTYTLAANEGCFAFTPHAAGNLFFAVVDTGNTVVVPNNSDATAFGYDPINNPVRPHQQFTGFTTGGYPYAAYVIWADGRDDYDNRRPDIPVLASAAKNGVPHVFTITRPINPLPPGPASCLFAIHGGGGEYHLFRPGMPARANLSLPLDDGIVVTPDDSLYANIEGVLGRSNTSWFGYTPEFDPFDAGPRTTPADDAVVVNFTQRRVHYILSWLLGGGTQVQVDPARVAMVGHSGGGRGTSHLTRLAPERFCAAVCYTPASDLTIDDGTRDNFLRGDWDQNLATNLPAPGGGMLGTTDVFTLTTRLSLTQRDFALTRYFYGKQDTESAAAWSPAQRGVVDYLNDSRMGFMISWDEREHGVELWHTETPPTPPSDIGQWVFPVRSYRASGQYLVDAYRSNQSYPGFFNSDQDANVSGRQPDPGPGDPNLGDAWGTWAGYFDWETATIVDTAQRWECTLFTTNLSVAAIDDCPVTEITTDLAPRKTAAFAPPANTRVRWTATDVTTSTVVQSGGAVADAEGVVAVTGLYVPRDPDRIRLAIFPCPADVDGDGDTDQDDLDVVLFNFGAAQPANTNGDLDGDGDVDQDDLDLALFYFGQTCS